MNFTKKELQDISRENADKWVETRFSKERIQSEILHAANQGKRHLELLFEDEEELLIEENALIIKHRLTNLFPELDVEVYGSGFVLISWE